MAQRRMFSLSIVDSDAFLDLPLSTQALYFHLNMRADDDGFIGNPKRIARLIGTSDDDLKLLIMMRFVLVFEDGVIVIKHWRMHNTIRKDRYTQTNYVEDFKSLSIKENGAYTFNAPEKTVGNQLATSRQPTGNPDKVRLGKDSIGYKEISSNEDIKKASDESGKQDVKENENEMPEVEKPKAEKPKKNKYGDYSHVLLTEDEYQKLKEEYPNYQELIAFLDAYIEEKGYKAKSHYLSIRRWVVNAVKDKRKRDNGIPPWIREHPTPSYEIRSEENRVTQETVDEVEKLLEEMRRNDHGN